MYFLKSKLVCMQNVQQVLHLNKHCILMWNSTLTFRIKWIGISLYELLDLNNDWLDIGFCVADVHICTKSCQLFIFTVIFRSPNMFTSLSWFSATCTQTKQLYGICKAMKGFVREHNPKCWKSVVDKKILIWADIWILIKVYANETYEKY